MSDSIKKDDWNKEFNCWTAPDGSVWGANAVVNLLYQERALDCAMHWGDLKKFGFEVHNYDAPEVDGRVRFLIMRRPNIKPCKMYNLGDMAKVKAKAKIDWKKKRSADIESRWKKNEIIRDRGEEWARGKYVERELGISKTMREYWDEKGWPILGGKQPRKYKDDDDGITYYAKTQVDGDLKSKIEAIPPGIPPDHPTLYSEEKTAELTKLSRDMLRHEDVKERHALVTEPFLARIDVNVRGTLCKKLVWMTGYTKASVRDYLQRRDARILPKGTVSLQALVRGLRGTSPKCTITHGTVIDWCREKLLDSELEYYLQTETAVRPGWIISEESAAEAKAVLRKCGWDTGAAKLELRNLHQQRVAENNGCPLPSRVKTRIAEQLLVAKLLAKERLLAEEPDGAKRSATSTPIEGDGPINRSSEAPSPPKNAGGRPRSDEVARKKAALIKNWAKGKYKSKAEAARAHRLHRPDVSKLIDEYERSKA